MALAPLHGETASAIPASEYPLIVLAGPTGSGKSRLAMSLAEALGSEIASAPTAPGKIAGCEVVSCDSVAVYRGLEIGSAKPSPADRARVAHHGLDLFGPDTPCTAGDYARVARQALDGIRKRGRLPIVVGGTGLYLGALLEGLAPAPPRDEALRLRLRAHVERRGSASLHRLLRRADPHAASLIHPHDTPKLVRSLEVSLLGRRPQTEQWGAGRDPLRGWATLRLGLDPPRPALYARLNARAAAMFKDGLLTETAELLARYGPQCRALGSLGYAQACGVLAGALSLPEAVAATQQGHRNYAKRQLTWFRRDPAMRWLQGFGDDPVVAGQALTWVRLHLGWAASMEEGLRY